MSFRIGIIFWLLVVNSGIAAQDGLTRLRVSIAGMESNQGQLALALFDSEQGFDLSSAIDSAFIEITADTVVWELALLPGNYAISCFHDENSNRKLERNWFGIPIENFGFSNNPRIRFSPPRFKDISFDVDNDASILMINLIDL